MRALRIRDQAVVHAVARNADFYFYARTVCGLHVYWKPNIDETVNSDEEDDAVDRLMTAEPIDESVDCMTCLVNTARKGIEHDDQ